MSTPLKIVYWQGERHWLGRLLDHHEIMSQGETIEELEENLHDAWREMLLKDMSEHHTKPLTKYLSITP